VNETRDYLEKMQYVTDCYICYTGAVGRYAVLDGENAAARCKWSEEMRLQHLEFMRSHSDAVNA